MKKYFQSLVNLYPENPKHVFPYIALFLFLAVAAINTLNTPVKPAFWIVLLVLAVVGVSAAVVRMVQNWNK